MTTETNHDRFVAAYKAALIATYASDPNYLPRLRAVSWVRNGGLSAQPDDYLWLRLAMRMTDGLVDNTSDKDGAACKLACKTLGLKCTYKAIHEFLKA